jgi:hypothetical protein
LFLQIILFGPDLAAPGASIRIFTFCVIFSPSPFGILYDFHLCRFPAVVLDNPFRAPNVSRPLPVLRSIQFSLTGKYYY